MATQTIDASQDDVVLGEKIGLLMSVASATPGSTVDVTVTDRAAGSWPGTIHVNAKGSGGCFISDVLLSGTAGTITVVTVTAKASNGGVDTFPAVTASVRVHG